MGFIKNLFASKQDMLDQIEILEETIDNLYDECNELKQKLMNKPKKKMRKSLTRRKGYHHISQKEIDIMIEKYNEGLSLVEISTFVGRSQSTVSNHIRKRLGE